MGLETELGAVGTCGLLNENGPYRLRCWDAWFPLGRAVCVGLGGAALLGRRYVTEGGL